MSGVRGTPSRFEYALVEGSREHLYALRRARWGAAYDGWVAAGRPDFLQLEPTPEGGLGREAGLFQSKDGEAA